MFVDAISLGIRSSLTFEETVNATRAALLDNGFGVPHQFDFQQTVLEQTGEDIGPYVTLAACHAPTAASALKVTPSVGTVLACNVAIFERDNHVLVHAINPATQMRLFDRRELDDAASDIAALLTDVLTSVASLSSLTVSEGGTP